MKDNFWTFSSKSLIALGLLTKYLNNFIKNLLFITYHFWNIYQFTLYKCIKICIFIICLYLHLKIFNVNMMWTFIYEIYTKIYRYLKNLKNIIYINILMDLTDVYKHCVK